MIEPIVSDPRVFTLHRYFIWADRMRVHYEEVLRSGRAPSGDRPSIESLLYMSMWYAMTYVVIEGWRELDLADDEIDSLLASPNVDLLRRYRNGVFHFQGDYFSEKMLELICEGTDVVPWIRQLRSALSRFFLQWLGQQRTD